MGSPDLSMEGSSRLAGAPLALWSAAPGAGAAGTVDGSGASARVMAGASAERHLVPAAAEKRQQEKEHVEDVEEDGGREQWGGPEVLAAAKALEVEGRQAREDHQAKDRVDQRAVRDGDEDRNDAEHDQPDQGPEENTGERREVAPGGVAGGPEPGDEQRRRCAGLPDRPRIGACVVAERWRHRESDEHPEPEQERDGEPLGSLGGDVHADEAGERGDQQQPAPLVGEVAAKIGADREQA